MFESLPGRPVLQRVDYPVLEQAGVTLDILRLDGIHPLVGGNKWFKLRLNLSAAVDAGHDTLLSFGGAYSNHIRSLAAAARLAGLRSIGVIRGELTDPLNPVLGFAQAQGMQLVPVTRGDYRRRQDPDFIASLRNRFDDFYLIPEGGSNEPGIRGCEDIVDLLLAECRATEPDCGNQSLTVALACGTGATLAGMVRRRQRLRLPWQFLGIAVLRDRGFLDDAVATWTGGPSQAWQVNRDYHFGGYARGQAALYEFIKDFVESSGIPLEPVYTGKLLFGICDLAARGSYPPGSRIIGLHTGGIY